MPELCRYRCAFLPATYQGTRIEGTGIADISNRYVGRSMQR